MIYLSVVYAIKFNLDLNNLKMFRIIKHLNKYHNHQRFLIPLISKPEFDNNVFHHQIKRQYFQEYDAKMKRFLDVKLQLEQTKNYGKLI